MTFVKQSIHLQSLFIFGLFISLFPWISFGLNEMGMQPYFIASLILALFFFFTKYQSLKIRHLILFLPMFFLIFQFFNGIPLDFLLLRDALSYLAFSISLVFFYEYLNLYGFPERIFRIALYIWILACIPQYLFGEHVYSFLLFAKSSANRGFTSLASEPSFFGLHSALITSLLILLGEKKNTYKYISLGLIALFLSASLAGFFYHGLFLAISLLLTKQLNSKLIIFAGVLISLAFIFVLSDQRFGELIRIIQTVGITQLLLIDASSGSRLADVLSPYILSYYNSLAPMGRVISELNQLDTLCYAQDPNSFLSCRWVSNDNKIGSYIGYFIFHFGLFIIPLMFYIFFYLIRDMRTFVSALILGLALMTTIPLGYPMVAFYLSSFIFFLKNDGLLNER